MYDDWDDDLDVNVQQTKKIEGHDGDANRQDERSKLAANAEDERSNANRTDEGSNPRTNNELVDDREFTADAGEFTQWVEPFKNCRIGRNGRSVPTVNANAWIPENELGINAAVNVIKKKL